MNDKTNTDNYNEPQEKLQNTGGQNGAEKQESDEDRKLLNKMLFNQQEGRSESRQEPRQESRHERQHEPRRERWSEGGGRRDGNGGGHSSHSSRGPRSNSRYSNSNSGHSRPQYNKDRQEGEFHNDQIIEETLESKDIDPSKVFSIKELKRKSPAELHILAETYGIENPGSLAKQDMIFMLLKKISEQNGFIMSDGVLEILQDGFGFLRSPETNYLAGPDDIYVSPNQVKRFGLKTGDTIVGQIRSPRHGERYFALLKINTINARDPAEIRNRLNFDNLTPLYPNQKLKLEIEGEKDPSGRIIDLICPLGKGQRALIVAPPRTGKTMLMQNIAHAIARNHPEVVLIVLLIDERPEEVTDMMRSVKGEVASSTFDEPAIRHIQLAEMVIEKAKRLVEQKQDVVILLDNITRLARAYNSTVPSSGKVLSGGVDSNALQKPKRFLGAARNIEEGGSLTIIGTALVETGSRMDEVIFEEFKGTGNAEIVLDRKISDKRTFPAIDVTKSGTRKEELLYDKASLSKLWVLRRILMPMGGVDGIDFLIDKLKHTKNNEQFFDSMNS